MLRSAVNFAWMTLTSMISIRIQNVSKHFESTVALQNVTTEISPGEIFFLLGPSGCGKTTLLRILAGFLIPDQGEIFFDDKVVTRIPPYRRKVGMVFQNYALWPHLSVSKNVAFGLEQLGIPRLHRQKRVEEILRTTRLAGFEERGIGELSGGQQQRVALARALAVHPPCLLLDEPLSNLDTQLRIQMRGELRALCRKQKITTIHVTHDQKEALASADRIAVMEGGTIQQIGTPEEIYRQPVNTFVASFIGDANLIPGSVINTPSGKTLVETGLGVLFSERPQSMFLPGDKCIVCIRPEALQIKPQNTNEENSFPAQIETPVFLGQAVEYQVQTKIGPLKVLDWMSSPRSGRIFLTAHPRDIVLLKTSG